MTYFTAYCRPTANSISILISVFLFEFFKSHFYLMLQSLRVKKG